jgi:isoleucyl-tRNA synthetase
VPGWDCHGLPIEQKALQQIGAKHTSLSPVSIRTVARRTALEAIEVQKSEMKQLGIMADWNNVYRTLGAACLERADQTTSTRSDSCGYSSS